MCQPEFIMGQGVLRGPLEGIFEGKNGFSVFAVCNVGIAPLDKRYFFGRRIATTPIGNQEESEQQDLRRISLCPPVGQHVYLPSRPDCSRILNPSYDLSKKNQHNLSLTFLGRVPPPYG